ncbi:MAG: hypothetical protein EPN85_06345 [Bacteroidetes bacterium]|nr:MAG: hypothetical protein EPN85_06345 [Bacteroidota bacterium]
MERIYRPETSFVSLDFFQAGWAFQSMWNPNKYMNVWMAKTSDYTSRGTMPYVPNDYPLAGLIATDYYKDNPPNYVEGILFLTPGGSYAGTSLTHETGHFLGLIHPYEDACGGTDYCNDTYQYDKKSGTNFDANGYTTDCNGTKFIEKNFMGWTLSTITEFVFSQNQVSRLEHSLKYAYHRPGSSTISARMLNNNSFEKIPPFMSYE